jgi:transglutaminase-like putative cysteine protease
MDQFLRPTDVIDWKCPEVLERARALADGSEDHVVVAKRCYEWVRDEIRHSRDFRLQPVPCTASEVLRVGSGFCYAKSHLLAAILRAQGIPAGLCYQRLSKDGHSAPFSLHGLNAVSLPVHGWYRVDPRGNRADVAAQFVPPVEQLAFPIAVPGEADIPGIFADPLPVVVEALRAHDSADALWECLPDMEPGAAFAC